MKTQSSLLTAALILTMNSADASAVAWHITDLGSAHNIMTMALNDNGWIVLGTNVLSPDGMGGYTTTQLFNAQGNANNFGLYDINNSNVVVGVDRNSASAQAFVWKAGTRTNLPQMANWGGYVYAEARGINDNGQVVGNTGDTAAIWTPNGVGGYSITPLGKDLGWTIGSGDGVAINNSGVGLMSQVYNDYRTGYSTGVGHTTIVSDQLGYPPVGRAINDSNVVAGSAVDGQWQRPFVWNGANVDILPVTATHPDSWNNNVGWADALNEANQIVGTAIYAGYDYRAVMWTQGATGWNEIDLNTIAYTGASFGKLTQARDINESGQILGSGDYFDAATGIWSQHIYLLTPAVPEPETWAMLLAGLGLIGLIQRRENPTSRLTSRTQP
jgi:hypothetical protein